MSVNLSFEVLMRIWDICFFEGMEFLQIASIALLKLQEPQLLKASFEKIIKIIKNIKHMSDGDELIKTAFSLGITAKKVKDFQKEYQEAPDRDILQMLGEDIE